jgi:hypothetical protein
MIPAAQTGQSGVPITNAVTGGVPSFWWGIPIKFSVGIDDFYPVTAAAVVAGGSGYAVGDLITLPGTVQGSVPIGAPVILQVLTAPGTTVGTVAVVNQVLGSSPAVGGSYFLVQTGTIAQASSSGSGTGASFTLTQGTKASQRVILTNQEYATMAYIKQITDPNLMDPLFLRAWIDILGANLTMSLTGDKDLANRQIVKANNSVAEARKADGNEGLTVNDVTPDWIRIRGVTYTENYSGPYMQGFDWGPMWSSF